MAVWILQPDQNGTCCACGVRSNPCDPCATCEQLVINVNNGDLYNPYILDTNNFLLNPIVPLNFGTPGNLIPVPAPNGTVIPSFPTGIIYKNGGVVTSILFSNNNSKLQTISSSTDYNVPDGPITIANQPSIYNYTFIYELSMNVGEIMTLYTETIPGYNMSYSAQSNQGPESVGPQGGSLSNICPPFFISVNSDINGILSQGQTTFGVLYSPSYSGAYNINAVFNNLSADPQISQEDDNNSVQFPWTTWKYIPNPSYNPNIPPSTTNTTLLIDCSSITNVFTKPTFPPQGWDPLKGGPAWASLSDLVNGCTSSSTAQTFAAAFGGANTDPASNLIGVQVESFFIVSNDTQGGPAVSCVSPPSFINYTATYQLQSITMTDSLNNPLPTGTAICGVVQCNNNGYIQLTDYLGSPIDLTTRIKTINFVSSMLP